MDDVLVDVLGDKLSEEKFLLRLRCEVICF